jgi:hypothetical protein
MSTTYANLTMTVVEGKATVTLNGETRVFDATRYEFKSPVWVTGCWAVPSCLDVRFPTSKRVRKATLQLNDDGRLYVVADHARSTSTNLIVVGYA